MESIESRVQSRFLSFLQEYRVIDPVTGEGIYPYVIQADQMKANDRTTLLLNWPDLHYASGYQDVAEIMANEFYHYENAFKRAINELLIVTHQEAEQEQKQYFLAVQQISDKQSIRMLKSSMIGRLAQFVGTVTRTYEVRPELLSATFKCMMCEKIIENVEQQFKFTEPKKCINSKCDNKSRWELILSRSVFTDFQKIRVQEESSDIPTGSMPRSIDVILHNERCDAAKPGDKCLFNGYLTVIPDVYSLSKPGLKVQLSTYNSGNNQRGQMMDGVTGLKSLGVRELSYRYVFVACHIEQTEDRIDERDDEAEADQMDRREAYANLYKGFEKVELEDIKQMRSMPNLFKNLADSIAPAVNGYTDIKKGILLMLMGGVNKKTSEGVNLRGDINCCIVGDPATAKSQFLKFTCELLPRSIYTSGKASSAAGLTASVHRDMESGEFCIEAGALMLADNGVCCIDEFDKMESKDQVAIHEAMEQQTISLAKAGIHATLNARTSILAAANPIFGRYDKSKTLKFNVNMSQPIMSRFDLFFIITDQCNEFIDNQIATHIVKLHSQRERAFEPKFTTEQLKRYIKFAKRYKPTFNQESAAYLKSAYIRLRESDQTSQKTSYRITVRQLESLIRLSEALARVHSDHTIQVDYVKEAEKLLSQSILQVDEQPIVLQEQFRNDDPNQPERMDEELDEQIRAVSKKEQKKANTIQLDHTTYYNMERSIVAFVQQQMANLQEEIAEIYGVKQGDILEWYILTNNITEAEIGQNERILGGVIKKMIQKEILVIVKNDYEDFYSRYLAIHPNYMD